MSRHTRAGSDRARIDRGRAAAAAMMFGPAVVASRVGGGTVDYRLCAACAPVVMFRASGVVPLWRRRMH